MDLFTRLLGTFGITNIVAINIGTWPTWAQLLALFVITDFIHWNVHRILHRVPWLWEFRKVHHSVLEMGFAAHLRFHWMENIVYKSAQYIPLAMISFGLQDFFIAHILATAIGHLNHSNVRLTYGPFKSILNNPAMHIWHHSLHLPQGHTYGINYGISISLWDYLFGTAVVPGDGRDIKLGFLGIPRFPRTLMRQLVYPLGKEEHP